MTADDLMSKCDKLLHSNVDYSAVVRPSVNVTYRDYVIHSCPAPSSGISLNNFSNSGTIALSTFNIIEGYDMSNATDLNVTTQWLLEAIKFAYGQRGDLADPAFVSNVTALEALFLEQNTGAVISSDHIHGDADLVSVRVNYRWGGPVVAKY